VQRQHAHNEEMSSELSRALHQITNTAEEAKKLRDQLDRETNTLDERKYVSNNISSVVLMIYMYLMCILFKKPKSTANLMHQTLLFFLIVGKLDMCAQEFKSILLISIITILM